MVMEVVMDNIPTKRSDLLGGFQLIKAGNQAITLTKLFSAIIYSEFTPTNS